LIIKYLLMVLQIFSFLYDNLYHKIYFVFWKSIHYFCNTKLNVRNYLINKIMQATFNLTIDILNNDFIEKLKTLFSQNAIVEIRVSELNNETDYLLSNPENRASIERSLKQLKENQVVTKTIEELSL